ncbi:hypothetical protein HID58_069795 [Brassica napus]|uniref:Endonuclease/exonuclease/phosphatase domain-containing protein n=1 Tax=Brassica napus TaxID=3708 RepID=A0ABQ7YX12_BRANA|nr:hypothetical protein HID58_069795 [Brassica napus]
MLGHNDKDCHEKQQVVILKRPEMEKQLVAEAGKTKDSDVGIGREAVSELLNELEQLTVNALLPENAGENGRELSLFLNNLSSGGSNRSSPPREKVLLDKVASPNNFQALQGIREEGEIDEDDGIEDELNLKTQDKRYEKGTEGEGKGEGKKAGRGKALIANTRRLVNAVEQMTSIFAWNMHGFNQPRKHNAVKYWIKEAKLRLGCLVETRVQEENFQQIFSATFQGWQYLHDYSHHRLGRIWVCWSEDVEVVPVLVSAQMITCWVKFKDTGDIFLASFIYGSNCMMERRDLWREMDTVARLVAAGTNPWILQGDFNVTKSAMEHSREFQDIIRSYDLVDIPHTGPEFTWINSQDGNPISKKLDRTMGNSSWISRFEQSHTLFEAGGVSDHSRMVTIVHDNPVGNRKPFKFFTHVVSHPQFLEVVDQVWNSTAPLFHSRTALKKLQDKLKMFKSELRRLNRESFGDLLARVKVTLEVLSDKQNNAMRNPCTTTFEEASDAWEHWHHLSGIEEQFFYQKSRVKWLDLGDRNTNFYHKTFQTRTSRNTIRRLITSDGRVLKKRRLITMRVFFRNQGT